VDPWHIVEMLVLAIASLATGVLGFMSAVLRDTVIDHGKRLSALERNIYTREDAERGRNEVKKEISELRQEMNQQHGRIFERLDDIADRLPPKKGG
jgi:hypothetical protein